MPVLGLKTLGSDIPNGTGPFELMLSQVRKTQGMGVSAKAGCIRDCSCCVRLVPWHSIEETCSQQQQDPGCCACPLPSTEHIIAVLHTCEACTLQTDHIKAWLCMLCRPESDNQEKIDDS